MYLVKTDNNGSLVGIDEHITETEIIIFPNPAHDYVYINGIPANFVNNVNLSITDLLGRSYLYEDFKINTIPFRLDISFLNNGVYLLNLTSGNNKLLNKIIIKH